MDFGALVCSASEALAASDGRELPPWTWVSSQLVKLFQQYPAGVSDPVLLTTLQEAWKGGKRAVCAGATAASPWEGRFTPVHHLAKTQDAAGAGGAARVRVGTVEHTASEGGATLLTVSDELGDGRGAELILHSRFNALLLPPPGCPMPPLAPGRELLLGDCRPWPQGVRGGRGGLGEGEEDERKTATRLLPPEVLGLVSAPGPGDEALIASFGRPRPLEDLQPAASAGVVRGVVEEVELGSGSWAPAGPSSQPPGCTPCADERPGSVHRIWIGCSGGGAPRPLRVALTVWGSHAAVARFVQVGDELVLADPAAVPGTGLGGGQPHPAVELELRSSTVIWVVPGTRAWGHGGGSSGGQPAHGRVAPPWPPRSYPGELAAPGPEVAGATVMGRVVRASKKPPEGAAAAAAALTSTAGAQGKHRGASFWLTLEDSTGALHVQAHFAGGSWGWGPLEEGHVLLLTGLTVVGPLSGHSKFTPQVECERVGLWRDSSDGSATNLALVQGLHASPCMGTRPPARLCSLPPVSPPGEGGALSFSAPAVVLDGIRARIFCAHQRCGRALQVASLFWDDEDEGGGGDTGDGGGSGSGGGGGSGGGPGRSMDVDMAEAEFGAPGAECTWEDPWEGEAAPARGSLWECAFCGVECGAGEARLSMEAELLLRDPQCSHASACTCGGRHRATARGTALAVLLPRPVEDLRAMAKEARLDTLKGALGRPHDLHVCVQTSGRAGRGSLLVVGATEPGYLGEKGVGG